MSSILTIYLASIILIRVFYKVIQPVITICGLMRIIMETSFYSFVNGNQILFYYMADEYNIEFISRMMIIPYRSL